MKICTIINYCTNDYRFINRCIESVRKFSNQIIITYSDFYYDGSPENIELLNKTKGENEDVEFVNINFTLNKFTNSQWCCYTRVIGFNNTKNDIDYILFLDADEIIESDLFINFLNSEYFQMENDYKIANYWYFREEIYRSKTIEDGIPFMYKKNLDINNVMFSDRTSLFDLSKNPKYRNVTFNGKIMSHHYSWVRTEEEMLKKVTTWGHCTDKDWISLVKEEFSREFNGTDFINRYEYEILK